MLNRDDSILYSGASSAAFASPKSEEVAKKREETAQEKHESKLKITPVAELIEGFIQDQLDEVQNIDFLNIEQMLTDENFRAEMMARKKYVQYLKELKNKMANILRERNG